MKTAAALAFLLVLASLTTAPARAQDYGYYDDGAAADVDQGLPDDYAGALAPYGTWTESDQYGEVWQPGVSVGWAPYVDGSWASTPYGWTWVSDEPWAWTFHYGRWVLLPTGWAWVPGYTWGPAWVDWYWGDGFVGWAPLPPFVSHVLLVDNFVFVHEHDFCARRVDRFVVDHRSVPPQVMGHVGDRVPASARPPAPTQIERVSGHPVPRFDRRPPGTIAPHHGPERTGGPSRAASNGGAVGNVHRLGSADPFGRLPAGVARLGRPWEPGRVAAVPPPQAPAAQTMVRPRQFVARPAPPAVTVRRVPAGGARTVVRPAPRSFGSGAMHGAASPAHGFHPLGSETQGAR